MNLPRKQIIDNLKQNHANDDYWFLAYVGKQFFKNNKLYTTLWLVSIENPIYELEKISSNWISIEILSHNINNYTVGSIYDKRGKLIKSYRRSFNELNTFKASLSVEDKLLTKGLFSHLNNSYYPVPPYEYSVLKGFPYYLKEITDTDNRKVKIIILNQVFINYFFLNYSTNLNWYILRNEWDMAVVNRGTKKQDGVYIGMLSYDKKKITKKAALMLGKYFYTKGDYGFRSLNQLSGYHIKELMSEFEKSFLIMDLPNIDNLEFDFIGQYIDQENSVFFAYGIQKTIGSNKKIFEQIDKIEVLNYLFLKDRKEEVDGDNKKENNLIPEHRYKLSNNVMENSSDHSSEVIVVEQMSAVNDFLDYIPKVENIYTYQDRDSNKKIFVKREGKLFTEGTLNMTDVDSDSQSTRVDLHLGNEKDIEWTFITIGALKKICSEFDVVGRFLRLNLELDAVGYQDIGEGTVPFSRTPASSKKQFNFMLFEFEYDGVNYYYMDTGPGRYAVLFSSTFYERISENRLNLFITRVINVYGLKWSQIYKKQYFESMDLKIIIYQPIEHTSKGRFEEEEGFVNHLFTRIKKRIIF